MKKNQPAQNKLIGAIRREILIEEGKYNQYRNKAHKSKKNYNRKNKHKGRDTE